MYYEDAECVNKAYVTGQIMEEIMLHHEVFGEKFFKTTVRVSRQSGRYDYIPVLIGERLLFKYRIELLKEQYIEISGQIRTYNKYGHLKLYLFALDINIYDECAYKERFFEDVNSVFLKGDICKHSNYRITALTNKKVIDSIILVERDYKKRDYIPCIVWGKNAYYVSCMNSGQKVQFCGRIQSREYIKRTPYSFEQPEVKTAYEISVYKML